jgi:hypothetical protein
MIVSVSECEFCEISSDGNNASAQVRMNTAPNQPALREILEAREFRLILAHHQVSQSGQEIPHVITGLLTLFVRVIFLLQQIWRVELI